MTSGLLIAFLQLAFVSGKGTRSENTCQERVIPEEKSKLQAGELQESLLQNSFQPGHVVSRDQIQNWRQSVQNDPPTEKWCNTATEVQDVARSTPVEVDAEYVKEEHCYWKWLDENCLSLKNCPRPPFGGNEKIWNRLRKTNQKNLILARMAYLMHFWAQKRKVKWSITHGSLLGAIRDQALIPHDSDVDVWLEDKHGYPALRKYFHEDFPPDLFLHFNRNGFLHMHDLNCCTWDRQRWGGIGGFEVDFYAHPDDHEVMNITMSRSDEVGMKFPGLVEYNEFLKEHYGDDYITSQPALQQKAITPGWSTDIGCIYDDDSCGIEQNKETGQYLRTADWDHKESECVKAHAEEAEWDGSGSGKLPDISSLLRAPIFDD